MPSTPLQSVIVVVRPWDSWLVRTLRWQVGEATVLRIGEVDATPALDGLLPDLDPAAVDAVPWLRPDFVDPAGRLRGAVQAFLVLLDGHRILVDPGIGEHKHREVVPTWTDLRTDFLARLRATGTAPEDVDIVLTTHLHFDHVGWMTRLVDGRWRPTFPAARHVICGDEFSYWAAMPLGQLPDQHAGFADSVRPVADAGLVDLVADDHEVTGGVRLVPSPGHTPHHVSVLLESGGSSALITGDVVHHPCQLVHPEWGAASDADPASARASREQLIARCINTDTLVIGSHFPDPVAGHLRHHGGEVRLEPVAS